MFTFDFETKGIAPRPDYPPTPVGVAVKGTGSSVYHAWGHPEGNDAPGAEMRAKAVLQDHWHGDLLCHHAAFDIAVAHERLGLPLPEGDSINDTLFLAFLLDPYGDLSLKPLAARYLGMAPEEQERVRDYLYTNKVIKRNVKKWAAHICEAPGQLVGQYAIGDVDRTKFLHDYMLPIVRERGMWEAYRRECDLVPMLLDNAAQGIPLDWRRLARDTGNYEVILADVERSLRANWKRDIGGTPPDNFDAGDELAERLQHNKRIVLPKTPTGRISTAKDALMGAIPDCKTKGLLLYRSALAQCLQMYMRPWRAQGEAMHCNWNQVRNYEDKGAKTGRLSSSPNLQNVTNPEKYEEVLAYMRKYGFTMPLPNLRSYFVAPKGMVLFSRDYSQQEFRLLAHFEGGVLANAYRDDPNLDMHAYVAELIAKTTDMSLERKPTKTINFAKIYFAGAEKLSEQLGVDLHTTYAMLNAYDLALPSIKDFQREVVAIGKRGEYIKTLGGRRYYAPPPMRDDYGHLRTLEYRLVNYLIQGSAGDQTKEAMRHWWKDRLYRQTDTRFLLTIHDQLVGCAPYEDAKYESEVLDTHMVDAFKLDVPVKTDPTFGYNFGEMTTKLPRRR